MHPSGDTFPWIGQGIPLAVFSPSPFERVSMPGRQAPAVHVTARQEELLRKLVRGTTTPQRLAVRAQIVLLAAAGHSSEQIVGKLVVTRPMVRKWRRRWSAPAACRGRRGVGLGGTESDLRDPGRRTPVRSSTGVRRVLHQRRSCRVLRREDGNPGFGASLSDTIPYPWICRTTRCSLHPPRHAHAHCQLRSCH